VLTFNQLLFVIVVLDAGDKVKDTVDVTPFSAAVMVAPWLVDTLPAVAVNDALLEPAGTETLAGTVRSCVLLDSETVTLLPAGPDKVTLHDKEVPAVILDAGQDAWLKVLTPDTGDKVKDTVNMTPFSVAVMVAPWLVDTLPAVAVNDAVLEPAGTETLAGTVRSCALLDSETVTLLPAGPDKVTLHDSEAPAVILDAEHETRVNVTEAGGLIVKFIGTETPA
jgi:hypothetical protein